MYEANYLATRLRAPTVERSTHVFLRIPEQEQSITFGDFFANAEKFAALLQDKGVLADDRVLIYAQKSVPLLELFIGCLLCGAIYVPINPELPIADLDYFIADAEPRLIVCGQKDLEYLAKNSIRVRPVKITHY